MVVGYSSSLVFCVCVCVCMYRYTAPHPVAKSLQFQHAEVSHVMSTKVIIFRFAEKALLERKSLRELYVKRPGIVVSYVRFLANIHCFKNLPWLLIICTRCTCVHAIV